SDAFQVLNQVLLVLAAEVQLELCVVVIDDVEQGGEPSVVEETALLMRPQSREGSRAVHVGRRAVGLERVDADLARRMHVVPRFGVERRDVTARTLARAV